MKIQVEPLKSMEKLYEDAASNSRNYKIYYELGKHYQEEGNLKRAYLCYIHSHFLCDQEEEALILSELIEDIKQDSTFEIPFVSIIIPTVPILAQMEAILNASLPLKEDCETVVILDLEESEEVTNWLHGNHDVTVVSAKGLSPYAAYQKAVKEAGKKDDLLLLDRGSALLSHALFHLRMSLYKNEEIGAVNAVTNGPAQGLTEFETPIRRADGYAIEHNLPGDNHMDPTLIPTCGSILVKRDCWEKVHGFDDSFLTLEVAQKDLSFQLLQNKKLTYLCHHGYVYTLAQTQNNSARWFDYNHFYEKWNVRLNYSLFSRPDILGLITDPMETPLKILDVGCACGASLLSMKNKFPNAELHGIELDPGSWNIASKLFPVTQGNVEQDLDYPLESFDYIIFGDVLEHLHQPEAVLVNVKRYLKPGGMILASIPNIMHISVLGDLLNGNFTYQDSGILDRTHLRFFTKAEIQKMFSRAGYEIADMGNTRVWVSEDQLRLIQTLCTISKSQAEEYMAYQYLVKAKKL
jgi:2-polyprenyl-3-methyl-5-hydroxy-6-metoxy-1,4-benzoquinol methylase